MDASTRTSLFKVVDSVMLVLGLLVMVSLVLEYGFYVSEELLHALHIFDYTVLGYFIFQDLLKMSMVDDWREYIRAHRVNFIFFGLLLLVFLIYNPWWQLVTFSEQLRQVPIRQIAKFYIVLTQGFILISTIFNAVKLGQKYGFYRFQPITVLLGSFGVIILLGCGLLMMPKATAGESGIRFVDALFTSTSATCVTGLIVVDTGTYFTRLGHWIILILMQAGGLGIMTLTAFFAVILGTGMSVRGRIVMRELLAEESMARIGNTLLQVLGLTLFFETVGVVAMYHLFPVGSVAEGERLFTSLFHSVSAFCNAGFSTFSDSLMGFSDKFMLVSTFGGLIIIGGIGFPVLVNLIGHRFYGTRGPFGKKKLRINLHTYVVLWVSFLLIIAGAVWIYFTQFGAAAGWDFSFHALIGSFFQSITARTAGFNTIDIGGMVVPAVIFIMILMFIGASPGSTGGGVKTSTFFLSLYALWARFRGKNYLEYRRRTIPNKLAYRSFMVILSAQAVIAASFILLTLSENLDPLMLLFESISAFGTVGLSMGATPELSTFGRYVIIATMYIGRVGPLALVIALGKEPMKRIYEYPKESIMLG